MVLFLPLLVSSSIAIGATLGAGVGGYLVLCFNKDNNLLDSGRKVLMFVFIGVISCAISSLLGVFSLLFGGFIFWANFVNIWFTWWGADAIEFIVFWTIYFGMVL